MVKGKQSQEQLRQFTENKLQRVIIAYTLKGHGIKTKIKIIKMFYLEISKQIYFKSEVGVISPET